MSEIRGAKLPWKLDTPRARISIFAHDCYVGHRTAVMPAVKKDPRAQAMATEFLRNWRD